MERFGDLSVEWGDSNVLLVDSAERTEYINSLKKADVGDYTFLLRIMSHGS